MLDWFENKNVPAPGSEQNLPRGVVSAHVIGSECRYPLTYLAGGSRAIRGATRPVGLGSA